MAGRHGLAASRRLAASARRLDDKLLWAIAAATLVYSVAATAVLGYFYPKSQSWFTIPSDKKAALMLFVLAAVLAPITEELLFRGWIYTSLRFSFGLWPAIALERGAVRPRPL